jgi:hypothetical protein
VRAASAPLLGSGGWILDHVVGLAYLPALGLQQPPRLYGPGRWLYEQVEFASGSRVLVHEAWYTEDAPSAQAIHSSGQGVERLVLIHVRPASTRSGCSRRRARCSPGPSWAQICSRSSSNP